MSTLYLHIGTSKTGTTSLQNFLAKNKETLLNENIFYHYIKGESSSCISLPYLFINDDSFSWYENMHNVKTSEDRIELRKRIKNNLINEFNRFPNHNWVISSEHIFNMCFEKEPIKNLSVFLSKYFDNIKIIIFVRDQLDYFLSSYSTQINSKFLGIEKIYLSNLKKSLKNPSNCKDLYYDKSLKNFDYYFGTKNIIAKEYYPDLNKDNKLIKTFLNELDINLYDEYKFIETANTRSSIKKIKLKHYVNANIKHNFQFNKNFGSLKIKVNDFINLLSKNSKTKFLPNSKIYKLWQDEFLESNINFKNKYSDKNQSFFKEYYSKLFLKKYISNQKFENQFEDTIDIEEKTKLKILIDILNNSQSIITNNKLSFSESSIDNINDYEIISKLDYLHKNINVLKISGFYDDKWCARDFSLKYSCKEDFATINIKIFNPSDSESSIKIRHNDNLIEHFVKRGESNILIESKSFADKHNNLIVNSNLNNNVEDDERDLSFIISDMVFK